MDWRSTPIKDCELSPRTLNQLSRWRFGLTLGDLDLLSDEYLLQVPQFGRKCLKEMRDYIASLKGDEPAAPKIDVVNWALEHECLIMALIKGEAVVVPKT